jgi:hypothetical protein
MNEQLEKDFESHTFVGQNVLEQSEVNQIIIGGLGDKFPSLISENPEIKTKAFETIWKIMNSYATWIVSIPNRSNEINLISVPSLLKSVEMDRISWAERVLFASKILADRNLANNKPFYNQENLLIEATRYLDNLVDPVNFRENGKKNSGKIITYNTDLLVSVGDLILNQGNLIPLYALYTKGALGKSFSSTGNFRQPDSNTPEFLRMKSYSKWRENLEIEIAESNIVNAVLFGADDLGFSTGFNSGSSIRNYFIQRGLIKDGE